MQVKLIATQTYPVCPCSFVINGKPYYQIRIPYQPLFQVTSQVKLNSSGNKLQSVLMILSGQITYVSIQESKAIISDASKYLGVKLEVDLKDITVGILSTNDTKLVIDNSDPSLLVLALKMIYQQIDSDFAQQISNSAITHLQSSNKNPEQKRIYKGHIQNIKKSNKKVHPKPQIIQNTYQIKQKQIIKQPISQLKPIEKTKKTQKYYVAPDENSNSYKKVEPTDDVRITAGINGNSASGWRQRVRPARYIPTKVYTV